jgi:gliding motility-associated-like protein
MRRFYFLLTTFLLSSFACLSQSCFNGFAGNDTTTNCSNNCITFKTRVPQIKTSETYTVAPIPYAPFAYATPGGTELSALYIDDVYSATIDLPFPFCFFGDVYQKCVVGSNGLITFDIASNASTENSYMLRLNGNAQTIPYAGGAPDNPFLVYYPRASIMGAYHDINPNLSPADRKIEYRTEGVAPCRRFIVSFFHIAHFGCNGGSVTTQQIVLHELTGFADVFFESKPVPCTGASNQGFAIMGLQNWDRTQAVAVPGRNCTVWSATNEGWRFTPNGATSRLDHIDLLLNNTIAGTGIIGASSNGSTAVDFTNICPPNAANNYVVRPYYTSCDAGGITSFIQDTVGIAISNTFNATYTVTPALCASPTGSITINVAPGIGLAPLQYSINGGPPGLSNVFNNLPAGVYTIFIKDAATCQQTLTITVPSVIILTGNAAVTNTSCPGVNNGTITLTPTSGTGPYNYSLNGGAPQLSNIFNALAPGTYTIAFLDANGCLGTVQATIAAGLSITSTSTQTNPQCTGINNGTLTVTPTSGAGPYSFRLNGGVAQNNGTFAALGPGVYTIDITDNAGCSGSKVVTLVPITPFGISALVQNARCFGEANASIIISTSGGTSPYSFSNNGGGSFQPTGSFSTLAANTYNMRISDFNGCRKDTVIIVTEPSLLTASAASTTATCNGNDGSITLTAGGGSPAYSYSIDSGLTYLPVNVFSPLPGTYNNIRIKDRNGCTVATNAVIALIDTMRLEVGPADTTICEWNGVTLMTKTNAQTNLFSWSPAIDLSDAAAANPVATPHYDIKYYLTATWGVCKRTDSITVHIKLSPIANAGLDTLICYRSPATLRGSVIRVSGPVSFLWSPPGRLFPPNSAVTPAQPDTTQQYVLEVSDNYGCNFKVYDTVLVTMLPPVPANAGRDTVAVQGVPHQLFASGGVSYVWTPAGPLDNPFSQNPKATINSEATFTVYVQNIAGCLGSDQVFIKVYKGPTYYLPNAFSPNGDGLNDLFRPQPVGIEKTDYFRIFNRYGELLYETKEYRRGWDGTYRGKKQDQGTYVWMIKGLDRDKKVVEMRGIFLLVR